MNTISEGRTLNGQNQPPDARKLVYVVEDDEEQLTLLRIVLGEAGFDVITESRAERVLAGVRELRPAVVLLDVMLPNSDGIDGFQLCQDIRRDGDLSAVRVIMVSAIAAGIGNQADKLRAQVGADDFFVKPYQPGALVARVRELSEQGPR